ncbi:pre-mRNA-splicing regulator WTAP-like [Actinia tenebrosa]|uniref:Pre-mRNA-splicing regulator WTAP-like n=1 Tax=Actinia tenebrosa TaxID=6105 RepID=A0A6P8HW96_ACTTE|nr:pre-mRNA-splicing regulator WTAP-like [Actinia tenebrosa]
MADKEQGQKKPSSEVVKDEPTPKRIRLDSTELRESSHDNLSTKWKKQDAYVNFLENKLEAGDQSSNSELAGLRESEERLKQQQQESTRRENVLVMRLATKEHEVQDLLTQIHDMKQAQNPSNIQMRSTLLDPAVNLLFQRMKTELDESKEKLEQAQSDLGAWKFTPDSVTGKKLMAKCRMLIQENQELGRQLSQGRVAQLEAELALQKKYSDELKSSQDELNGFVIQLDEEVEGMQSTIMTLQQQLKSVKQQLVQQSERTQELQTKYEDMERELEAAKQQNASTAAISSRDQVASSEQAKCVVKEDIEIQTDGIWDSSNTPSKEKIRTPTPNNVSSTSNINPSSFSINNLLSLETPKQDNKLSVHAVVPKLENGHEGGDPAGTIRPSPPPLEPGDSNPLQAKGIADGIGTEVNAFNVETVN